MVSWVSAYPEIVVLSVLQCSYHVGLTWRPDPLSEEHAFKAMKTALAQGCNLWNGGEFYGPPEHNSLTLLNTYFTKYPEDADKIVLTIKGA